MNDDELRVLYQEAIARRQAPDRVACPAPEALLALIERQGAEAERLAVLDHVMACEACRGEFDLLRAVNRAASVAEPAPGHGIRSLPRAPLALAAALVLLIAGAVLVRGSRVARDAADVMRGEEHAISLVGPTGAVTDTAPLELVWRAVPAVRFYEVEVLDAGGDPVFTASTPDTVVQVPLTQLRTGGGYRWWVQARTADGAQLRSGLGAFRMRTP